MKAFPMRGSWQGEEQRGMDLRDYFAAKAMEALMKNSTHSYMHNHGVEIRRPADEEIAMYAYEMADAMMKARGE
jgi:predicted metalloprotease with PDZ domain